MAWRNWVQAYRAMLRAEGWAEAERVVEQNKVNPCYIPRNHTLEVAIKAAEAGDFSEVCSGLNSNISRIFDYSKNMSQSHGLLKRILI